MLVRATPGLSLENSSFAPSVIARLVEHCLPLASFIGSWRPSATAPAIVAAIPKATSISNNVQPALFLLRFFIFFFQTQLCSQFPHKKRADSVRTVASRPAAAEASSREIFKSSLISIGV